TDFTPTVTYGIVSGVNRYQYPANGLLEYTDCIQVDASINPGNSGGPLFNTQGELIGINGRISLEKRGRVNVGVGYAISINQIKNIIGIVPRGWRMPMKFRHVDAKKKTEDREVLVRLMGVQRQESRRQVVRDPDQPRDQPRRGGPPPAPPKPPDNSPATKLYE